ncbi:hypothetical protein [Mesorhizobium sp. WSM3866]|uniref:hypothetical protein n=1 Tax=Mesorhizobium sp. WSM3866 TaxID=422271 RepID=UPI001141068D|nr:hypothetical protein [Mesorhizobium sp. WSM3866]
MEQGPALDRCRANEPFPEVPAILGYGSFDDLGTASLGDPAVQVTGWHGPTLWPVELPGLKAQFLLDLVSLHRQAVLFNPSHNGLGENLKFLKARHRGNWVSNVPQPIRMGPAEAAKPCALMGATFMAAWKSLVPKLPKLGKGCAVTSIGGHPRCWVSPLAGQCSSLGFIESAEVALAPRWYRKQKYSSRLWRIYGISSKMLRIFLKFAYI